MPEAYAEFMRIATLLENHYRDMQDMEFTIEDKNCTSYRHVTVREQLQLLFRSLVI